MQIERSKCRIESFEIRLLIILKTFEDCGVFSFFLTLSQSRLTIYSPIYRERYSKTTKTFWMKWFYFSPSHGLLVNLLLLCKCLACQDFSDDSVLPPPPQTTSKNPQFYVPELWLLFFIIGRGRIRTQPPPCSFFNYNRWTLGYIYPVSGKS